MGKGEIAHDRIRFPKHEIALDQRRHVAVRIHRKIVGLVVFAERHAGIDTLIGDIEFAQAPQHFLNVHRIGPAPDRELFLIAVRHALSLPMIRTSRGHIGIFGKKRVLDDDGRSKRSGSVKFWRSLIGAKRNCS